MASGETVTYEAMASGSVGIIMCVNNQAGKPCVAYQVSTSECATDNATRTIANVRDILSDHGYVLPVLSRSFTTDADNCAEQE